MVSLVPLVLSVSKEFSGHFEEKVDDNEEEGGEVRALAIRGVTVGWGPPLMVVAYQVLPSPSLPSSSPVAWPFAA